MDLLFAEDDDTLIEPGIVKTLFDPACGTGGMLAVAEERLRELNPKATLEVFGQELNDESYAICRSDMMLKGHDATNIVCGNSFSLDGFGGRTFDYMLANPPYGVDWKKAEKAVRDEAKQHGFGGRFGAGVPTIKDGQLLFLQHMVSKMRPTQQGGSTLAIVFNGSPLFGGAAASGESEIRRWIIENDWLEAIVALPDQLFYTFQANLHSTGLIVENEIDGYWAAFSEVAPNSRKGNAKLYAALDPTIERFKALDDNAQEEARGHLDAYIRAYSFLAQIVSWTDGELEKLYVYAKSLLACLPPRDDDASLDLGAEVALTHLRIEMAGEVDASIRAEDAEVNPLNALPGSGGGKAVDPEKERLSSIIERLNEKHAFNLTLTDALLFEQFKGDWTADPELAAQATANDFDNFMLVFVKKFFSTVLARMDTNADIFKAINDDEEFADALKIIYGREVYEALRQTNH